MSIRIVTVSSGVIQLHYDILQVGDEGMYDWVTSNGESSDVWFDSIEEAEEDVRTRYE